MNKVKELSSAKLRPVSTVPQFQFKTTADLSILTHIIGQPRARAALSTFMTINKPGYNLYAMGPAGIGKKPAVLQTLSKTLKKAPPPPDWCYVNNPTNPSKPLALCIPPGKAAPFAHQLTKAMEKLSYLLSTLLNHDEYQTTTTRREKENKNLLLAALAEIEHNEKKRIHQLKLIQPAINHIIHPLIKKYHNIPAIKNYLMLLKHDISYHHSSFMKNKEGFVNILTSTKSVPIIYENNPTYENLFGKIEFRSHKGSLITDYRMIKPGALHKANGGYLLVDVEKILKDDIAWDALKNALRSNQIIIDGVNPAQLPVQSLQPEPIPLDIKIILLGDRTHYYLLSMIDPEFLHLFKLVADFDEYFPRTLKNQMLFARLIATLAQKHRTRPLNKAAVIQVINEGCRLIEDTKNLLINIRDLSNLICEANHFAEKAHHKIINADDIDNAIEAKVNRMSRLREQTYEEIQRDTVLINTTGEKIGQVNAISVVQIGEHAFAHPSRITAIARIGRSAEIINIEREIDLSGSIHAKGILILAAFMKGRYALTQPISLWASIVFEQTYACVDGDSASTAELCALLSALSKAPINQSFAVTGSINQYGEIQSIGYVNEKIEGFFDICEERGLTGKQGVLIPATNQQNIILKPSVVKAVKARKFHIYPIKTIDDAIQLLMNKPAGKRNKKGNYPKNSVNFKVEHTLKEFAKEVIEEKTSDE